MYHIFAASDATGTTAERVLRAALTQFDASKVTIKRYGGVRSVEEIREIVHEASLTQGFIVHTFVSVELRQVILNLVSNALDVTPPGGTVAVRARSEDSGVRLAVADSGPGIPVEERERVFEPFATSREDRPGGLGLSITRRLVTEAGGRIEITDAEAGGAEFRVFLGAVFK